MKRLPARRVLIGAGAMALLAACGSQPTAPGSSAASTTPTRTVVRTSSPPTGSIDSGPTTVSAAGDCPFLAKQTAADTVGMRLARVTVLSRGGRTIGCRFYAISGGPLATSEHLPGPNQPALELTSARYTDATDAHNAMVRLASAGQSPQQVTITGAGIGLAFRTAFDPTDRARDWAVAASVGRTLVVVKAAVADTSFNAVAVASAVAPKFR